MINILKILFSAILLSAFFGACSSVKTADCINFQAKKSELTWGTILNNQPEKYYTLKMDGTVAEYLNGVSIDEYKIKHEDVCELMQEISVLILEIQSLNVPAEKTNFVIFRNPETDYFFRAVWNPEHDNDGNKKFKEYYNKLLQYVKK